MRKVFSVSFSFFSDLSYGSIYPTLRKMKGEGLITMEREIQENAPTRKVYTITEAGRKAFLETLKTPLALGRTKSLFLMRLFFFAHLSAEEGKAIGGNYLDSIQRVYQQLEAARPEIEAHADRFQFLCFQFGLRFFDDLAKNVREVIRALEEEEGENNQQKNRGEGAPTKDPHPIS
jgi:DNA-binding PadR family transcriptional regulator